MTLNRLLHSLLFAYCLLGYGHASARLNQQPIKILVNDWTSQIVLSHIAGQIFIKQGYAVSYLPSSIHRQWYSLKFNNAHVQMEVWEGTMADQYHKLKSEGDLVDAGDHDAYTREDWWYPLYVEDFCPGLPDWRALNHCYQHFIDPRTEPMGMYLGGPWEKPDAAKIRALNLKFMLVKAQSGDELQKALIEAVANRKPIILFNWTPNSIEAQIRGKFIEFPDYDPKCETDPAWGVNSRFAWDCGNPKSGWLKKVASTNFPEEWPCAFATLQNINFNNAMIAAISSWTDINKIPHKEAAKKWMNENPELWASWIPAACSDE